MVSPTNWRSGNNPSVKNMIEQQINILRSRQKYAKMSVCLQIGVEAAGSLLRTPLQNEERCTWWPCAKVMSLAQKKSVERPALSGFLPLGGFPHYLTCQPAVMCSYCN
ncbi:uncharacterized protein LOC144014227 isoform X1 [Festucalex cinctus]